MMGDSWLEVGVVCAIQRHGGCWIVFTRFLKTNKKSAE